MPAGCTAPTSDHVERGEVNPTLVTILAIAEGLDLDPETFVVGLRLRPPRLASAMGPWSVVSIRCRPRTVW